MKVYKAPVIGNHQMKKAGNASGSPTAKRWEPADWIAVLCTVGIFMQLMGAWANLYLGKFAYLRDIYVGGLVCIGIALDKQFLRNGTVRLFLVFVAFLTGLMIIAGARGFLVPALTVAKWEILWVASLFCGFRMSRLFGRRAITIVMLVLVGYCALEAMAGLWEYKRGMYLFNFYEGEETAIGREIAVSQKIEGALRIRGTQRSVFVFANLMATAAIASLTLMMLQGRRQFIRRLVFISMFFVFSAMLFASGGRSGILGLGMALLWYMIVSIFRRNVARYGAALVAISWVIVAVIAFCGIGPLVEAAVNAIKLDSPIGNVSSSYGRDIVWKTLVDRWGSNPVAWFFGMPVGGTNFDYLVSFADNWVIWLLYHTGVIGLSIWVLWNISIGKKIFLYGDLGASAALWAGLLTGESIARESFFFFSSLMFFFILGSIKGEHRSGFTESHGKGSARKMRAGYQTPIPNREPSRKI